MALLATQATAVAGVIPAYTAASATDTFVPDDRTFVHVLNTNAATRTVSVAPAANAKLAHGIAVPAMTSGTIAATTGTMVLGPFPADQYADSATGFATLTPSATAGITYAVVRVQAI